ncbi:MAG: nucleotidyltransferase family protein, partial [Caulobacteraceae bacterium]
MNAELLVRLRDLELPQCYHTAGCLFQPIWNQASCRSAEWGIKDYDVFYFDPDTSWDAEDQVI